MAFTRLCFRAEGRFKIPIRADDRRVAGLLLQVLPGHGEERTVEAFETAAACAATVSLDELTRSAAEELLPKLFAGQAIRLFSARPVAHDCRCTPERLAGVVRMLGAEEVKSLLAEQGHVELTCELCNRAFRYDDCQVDAIMRGTPQESSAIHCRSFENSGKPEIDA